MKILRQSLVTALILALALPAWAANEVVGTAVNTQSATVRQANLAAGSTVFSGDSISAGANGRAQVVVPGGGRVEVLSNSTVRIDRSGENIALTVERGTASFQTRPESQVAAIVTDAKIQAPKGSSAMGFVRLESPDSVLVVAKIGALEVVTEHDSKSVLIPEGSAARVTLLPEEPAQGPGPVGAQPAGRKRRRLAMVLILGGGAVTAGAILAATGGSDSTPVSPSAP